MEALELTNPQSIETSKRRFIVRRRHDIEFDCRQLVFPFVLGLVTCDAARDIWREVLVGGIKGYCNDDELDTQWLVSDEQHVGSFSWCAWSQGYDPIELRCMIIARADEIAERLSKRHARKE